jgi:hypothetical protein
MSLEEKEEEIRRLKMELTEEKNRNKILTDEKGQLQETIERIHDQSRLIASDRKIIASDRILIASDRKLIETEREVNRCLMVKLDFLEKQEEEREAIAKHQSAKE